MNAAIKIAVDGTIERVDVELGYPGLNKLFDDGLIELAHTQRLTDEFEGRPTPVMIVDEEGRIKGLPRNESATRLYVPSVYRNQFFIRGDAYILGEDMTDEGSDLVGVPSSVTVEAVTALVARFEKY